MRSGFKVHHHTYKGISQGIVWLLVTVLMMELAGCQVAPNEQDSFEQGSDQAALLNLWDSIEDPCLETFDMLCVTGNLEPLLQACVHPETPEAQAACTMFINNEGEFGFPQEYCEIPIQAEELCSDDGALFSMLFDSLHDDTNKDTATAKVVPSPEPEHPDAPPSNPGYLYVFVALLNIILWALIVLGMWWIGLGPWMRSGLSNFWAPFYGLIQSHTTHPRPQDDPEVDYWICEARGKFSRKHRTCTCRAFSEGSTEDEQIGYKLSCVIEKNNDGTFTCEKTTCADGYH